MKDVTKISQLTEEDCRITVLVTAVQEQKTKDGKSYAGITVTDGEAKDHYNNFDMTVEAYKDLGIEAGRVATLILKKNGSFRNVISAIPCNDPEKSPSSFVKNAPIDKESTFNYILDTVQLSSRPDAENRTRYAEVAISLLSRFKDAFIRHAAAKDIHHNYLGGLLQHTANMVAVADSICRIYPELDRELLICGCALHDIGKICEFNTSETGDVTYTPQGSLLGHLYLGTSLVERTYMELGRTIGETELQLLHLIASHHGKQEWGAIETPATMEALMLHYIDMIDSRMQTCEQEYERLEPGTLSETKNYSLGTRAYRPLSSL